MDSPQTEQAPWAQDLERYRPQLLQLAARQMPVLLRRVAEPEDLVQETLAQACRKADFFTTRTEVPVYCKLRTLLLHALADAERRYLRAQKRDLGNDVPGENGGDPALQPWNRLAASVTGPFSHLAREERFSLLRQAVAALGENDRSIIELFSFDGMTHAECAAVLGITPKAAGLRYLHALQRLRKLLADYSLFRP